MAIIKLLSRYFDLNYEREVNPEDAAKRRKWVRTSALSLLEQGFLYSGVLLGVLLSNYSLEGRKPTYSFDLVGALLIALLVTPSVYESLASGSSEALLKRFAFFVSQGMSWRSLISFLGNA